MSKCVECQYDIRALDPIYCISCELPFCMKCSLNVLNNDLILCSVCLANQSVKEPCLECKQECDNTKQCDKCNNFYCTTCINLHSKCYSCQYDDGYQHEFINTTCKRLGINKCNGCKHILCDDHFDKHRRSCPKLRQCQSCNHRKRLELVNNQCRMCGKYSCEKCYKPIQCRGCKKVGCSLHNCMMPMPHKKNGLSYHEWTCQKIFRCYNQDCTYVDIRTDDSKFCIAPYCLSLQCPYCIPDTDYNMERYDAPVCTHHKQDVLSEKGCCCCGNYFPRSKGRILRLNRIKINNVRSRRKIAKMCCICFDEIKAISNALLYLHWPKDLIEIMIIMYIKQ